MDAAYKPDAQASESMSANRSLARRARSSIRDGLASQLTVILSALPHNLGDNMSRKSYDAKIPSVLGVSFLREIEVAC